ncbi:hypothetical protein BGZ96_000075 [Linnemannia gamsii]|uniref:Uncharacterized protein n=1 Tax=Linnemannia gamsii TaxID=64522 RepID=A0ABQ7KFJ7_9FUNG|nr:hypothetical protein BGZ96_000075 [Linnemannia gamsii]
MDSLSPINAATSSNTPTSSTAAATSRKPPAFRNLQPRAAAGMDFNDNDSDDEDNGILSADYIAQRKTTQDLVDFFKSAPPPSSNSTQQPLNLSPIEDEKKKKPLLQWLRPKKSGSNLNASASSIAGGSTLGGGTSGRNSMLVQGAGSASNISTVSGVTMGKGKNGEDITTSTLPNGRKYIMIAVDYKEGDDGTGLPPQPRSAGSTNSDVLSISNGSSFMTTTRLPNGGTVSRRQSRVPDDALTIEGLSPGAAAAKRLSILSSTLGSDLNGSGGGEKRRSILQTNDNTTDRSSISDGSKYILGEGSFLLENFALDTDFMGQATGVSASGGGPASSELQRSASNKSGATAHGGGGAGGESAGISRTGSKRGNKVKFSFLGDPNADDVPMDEAVVAEALAERLASYKAQQQGKSTTTTTTSTSTTTTTGGGGSGTSQDPQQDYPEIVLPKPVSRKKVRHVQIQTQHCVMRAMHTQTEPYENLVHDLDVKEWSSAPPSISGSTEVGSSTASSTITSSSVAGPNSLGKKDASTGVVTSARPNSKVASLVASLTQPTAATTVTTTTLATRSAATSPTTTTPPTPFPNPIDNDSSLKSPTTINTTSTTTTTTTSTTSTENSTTSTETSSPSSPRDSLLHEELAQLREQNATLQSKVSSLQRDLAAETRARNRTTVAMQDTRDKFEMLSAMAYKKLKEMIFQRHILEMEVRELRTQADLHSEVSVVREGEMLFRQEQQQQQQQQMMHHHQQQQYLYQTA